MCESGEGEWQSTCSHLLYPSTLPLVPTGVSCTATHRSPWACIHIHTHASNAMYSSPFSGKGVLIHTHCCRSFAIPLALQVVWEEPHCVHTGCSRHTTEPTLTLSLIGAIDTSQNERVSVLVACPIYSVYLP